MARISISRNLLATGAMTYFAARQVTGIVHLRASLRWLASSVTPGVQSGRRPDLHIVVPLYCEQDAAPAALDYFRTIVQSLPGTHLIFVTTDRDITHPRGRSKGPAPRPTTKDVLLAHLAKEPSGRDVRVINYSGTGRKAAQVNFAVSKTPIDDRDYLAVYDVDSRPTLRSLTALTELLASGVPVVQQSAEFHALPDARGMDRQLVAGAADLQTLWTLRREVPSFRRYAANSGRGGLWGAVGRGLAQTVGHGIVVRADTFRRTGGLPTYTRLDDLPFGYMLTVTETEIRPHAGLTTALTPATTTSWLTQGARWFDNYLDYWLCWTAANREGRGSPAVRAFALATGWYRGVTWLGRSPLTAAALVLPVMRPGRLAKGLAVVGLYLYLVEGSRLLAQLRGRSGVTVVGVGCLRLTAATLLSSVGPLLAVGRWLLGVRWQDEFAVPQPPQPGASPTPCHGPESRCQ